MPTTSSPDPVQDRRLERLESFSDETRKSIHDLEIAYQKLSAAHDLLAQEMRTSISDVRKDVGILQSTLNDGVAHLETRMDRMETTNEAHMVKITEKVDQALRYTPPWVMVAAALVSALGTALVTMLVTAHVASPTRTALTVFLGLAIGGVVGWTFRRYRH